VATKGSYSVKTSTNTNTKRLRELAQLRLEHKQSLDALTWERQKTLRLEAQLRAERGKLKQLAAQMPKEYRR
jgi:hypothetical protein